MSYSFNHFRLAAQLAVVRILADPNIVIRIYPAELAGRWYLERVA